MCRSLFCVLAFHVTTEKTRRQSQAQVRLHVRPRREPAPSVRMEPLVLRQGLVRVPRMAE
jgi:hypothetical protein